MLKLDRINASYGPIRALENVSLEVKSGQIVCLLGANGAGKTTTLNCISGLVALTQGRISFDGEDITNATMESVVKRGLVQVPEGREIFPTMSVEDNLTLGAWVHRSDGGLQKRLDHVFDLFPRLRERAKQATGTLSGGEQQMLMIGRALMAKPKLIMFDEPSLGLSPILVRRVFETIKTIHQEGTPILLVEQNVRMALEVSDYGYILENGEITHHGTSEELKTSPEIQEAYLGEERKAAPSHA